MEQEIQVAVVGIEAKELLVLKSVLNLVGAGANGPIWRLVDRADQADLAFIGHVDPAKVAALVEEAGERALLVYCCSREEAPPTGIRALAHCPPRANDIKEVFVEAVARRAAAPKPAPTPVAPPAQEIFEVDHCLAGVIHARLLRLLIDQPLAVSIPGAPCLLVDVHNGVRTIHAAPAWLTACELLRADPALCRMEVATDAGVLSECRRQHARPYMALRFWGVMCASRGRPVADVARAKTVGLKKLPEFKVLPHLDWQPALAQAMVGKAATLAQWAASAGRQAGEVVDFLNACSTLGLVKTG